MAEADVVEQVARRQHARDPRSSVARRRLCAPLLAPGGDGILSDRIARSQLEPTERNSRFISRLESEVKEPKSEMAGVEFGERTKEAGERGR